MSPAEPDGPAEGGEAGLLPARTRRLLEGLGLFLLLLFLVLRLLRSGAGADLSEPSENLLVACFGLAGAALIGIRTGLGTAAPRPARAPLVLTGFGLLGLASATWAAFPWAASRVGMAWTTYGLVGLALAALAGRASVRRSIVAVLGGAAVAAAALGLCQLLIDLPGLRAVDPRSMPIDPRLHDAFRTRVAGTDVPGPFILSTIFGGFGAACLGLGLGLVRGGTVGRRPRTGILLAVLGGAALLLAASKGAFLAAGAAVLAVVVLGREGEARRRALTRLVLPLAVAGSIGGAVLVAVGPERVPGGASLAVRLEYWRAAVGMTGDHPLTGVGANNFRSEYTRYKPTRGEETRHAHQIYLQALAELGPVGLGLLLLFALEALLGAAGASPDPREDGVGGRDPPGRGREVAVSLGAAACGAVVAAGLDGDPLHAVALVGGGLVGTAGVHAAILLDERRSGETADDGDDADDGAGPAALAVGFGAVLCAFLLHGTVDLVLQADGLLCLAVVAAAVAGRGRTATLPRPVRFAALLPALLLVPFSTGLVQPLVRSDLSRAEARVLGWRARGMAGAGGTIRRLPGGVGQGGGIRAAALEARAVGEALAALDLLRGACEAAPFAPEPRADRAEAARVVWLLTGSGRHLGEALEALDRAIRANRHAASLHHRMGRLAGEAADRLEGAPGGSGRDPARLRSLAIAAHRRAVQFYPTRPGYRLDLARLLLSVRPGSTWRGEARLHLRTALSHDRVVRDERNRLAPAERARARRALEALGEPGDG